MKNKGYIFIAKNNNKFNYVEQAYALALSIKTTQKEINKTCIIVDSPYDLKNVNKEVFDDIIIDYTDRKEVWNIHDKYKYYNLTPFDESIILDTDMIFNSDVSHWWDGFKEDLHPTLKTFTYRNTLITNDYYRKAFTDNNLQNVHTAFFYFNRNTQEYFKLIEDIFKNWEKYYTIFKPEHRPKFLSGDVAYALAAKIMNIDFIDVGTSFVHMKSKVQDVENLEDNWSNNLPTVFNENLYINNFLQSKPFHYADKTWLTKEIIKQLEKNYERM